jgi:hypothetical protein
MNEEEFKRREEARNDLRCPDCGARLRFIPSPIDGKKLTFCDEPLCPYFEDADPYGY